VKKPSGIGERLSRRDSSKSTTAAGLGAAIAAKGLAKEQTAKSNPPSHLRPRTVFRSRRTTRIALIAAGQGRGVLESCLRIPACGSVTVCDIWNTAANTPAVSQQVGQPTTVYEDYRDLLAKREGPKRRHRGPPPDWSARRAYQRLSRGGLHVTGEKEM